MDRTGKVDVGSKVAARRDSGQLDFSSAERGGEVAGEGADHRDRRRVEHLYVLREDVDLVGLG